MLTVTSEEDGLLYCPLSFFLTMDIADEANKWKATETNGFSEKIEASIIS